MRVRRGVASDAPAASAVLADAFSDYPWTKWTIDGHRHTERVEGLQRLIIDRVALPYGEVWVACDNHGDVMSAALWMVPGSAVPPEVFTDIAPEQARLEGARHDAAVKAEACVAGLRPTGPHYFLGTVGTRRDCQGRGFGAAVLLPVLDRANRTGETVFLETSTRRNLDFYAKLGFVVAAELDVPDGGPHVWAMTRHISRL